MGMKFLLILPPTDWLTGPNLHPHQHRVAIHRGHGTFSTRLQKIDDSMMSTHVQITEKPGATLHKLYYILLVQVMRGKIGVVGQIT